jgi:hypothetical protein
MNNPLHPKPPPLPTKETETPAPRWWLWCECEPSTRKGPASVASVFLRLLCALALVFAFLIASSWVHAWFTGGRIVWVPSPWRAPGPLDYQPVFPSKKE